MDDEDAADAAGRGEEEEEEEQGGGGERPLFLCHAYYTHVFGCASFWNVCVCSCVSGE